MCHLVAQCCVSIVLNAEGSEELSEVHLRRRNAFIHVSHPHKTRVTPQVLMPQHVAG